MAKIAFPSPVNPDGRPETVSPWPCVDLAAHTRSRLTTATEEELCWACVIGEFSVSCSCHMWVGPGLQQVPWPHFFGLAGLAPGSICGKMNFGSRAAAAAFLTCPDLVDSNSGPLNAPQGPVHRRFFFPPQSRGHRGSVSDREDPDFASRGQPRKNGRLVAAAHSMAAVVFDLGPWLGLLWDDLEGVMGCNAAAPLELSCTSAESDSSRCRKRRNPHVSHRSVVARLIGRPNLALSVESSTSPLALDRCLRSECLAVGRKDPGTSTHYMATFANQVHIHPGEMIRSVANALRTKPKGMRIVRGNLARAHELARCAS